MDPITQGLLGAVAAQVFCCRSKDVNDPRVQERAPAVWWVAALSAMAPDLDILFGLHENPMIGLFFHRHFTHSFFFVPIGALFLTVLLWTLYKKQISFRFYYKVTFIGMATHGLLDACTAYGTLLFWPFSTKRVALDVLPIVDILFTSILFLGCVYTHRAKKVRGALLALLLVSLYTLFGFWQSNQAQQMQRYFAEKRGHQIEKFRVTPTLNNLFLWRSIYAYQGKVFADSMYVLPGRENQFTEGESQDLLEIENFANLSGELYGDIRKFYWFADDWVTGNENLILDARYSILAHTVSPMWGLKIKDGYLSRWREGGEKIKTKRISLLFDILFVPWGKALGLVH